nr:LysR family transcriptional regulator [Microlunatus antarcticus]
MAAFLVVCEEAHYARAARRLHLSASALTRQVQHLEQQLGTRLIERGPAGFERLTPAGERLRGSGPALLEHARTVGRTTAGGAGTMTLRVGLPGAVGDYPSRRLLDGLRARALARRPSVHLRFLGVPLPLLDESLDRELVDVLWTIEHAALRQHQTVLAAVERVGLVARSHRLPGNEVDGGAFAELPLLRDPTVDRGWMAPWVLADLRPTSAARLVDVSARGVADVIRAVAEDRAVTVVHAPQARYLPSCVRTVALTEVAEVRYVAARRVDDRRREVSDVIALMRESAVRDATSVTVAVGRDLLMRPRGDRPGA